MTTKNLDFACELKATGDTGTFEGYGSVFNITDKGGDIVVPGAFTETLSAAKSAGRLPAMLWQETLVNGQALGWGAVALLLVLALQRCRRLSPTDGAH